MDEHAPGLTARPARRVAQTISQPRRRPAVTAAVRLRASSLPRMAAMWNFTVVRRDPEALGDRAVAQALGHHLQNLELARRELIDSRLVRARRELAGSVSKVGTADG